MQLFEKKKKKKMKKKAIKSFKKNYGITMPDSDNDTDNINGIEMKENDEIDTSTNLSDIKKLDDSQ